MPVAEGAPRTLYDKVFQDHIVDERLDGTILLYIGKWLIISSEPQKKNELHLTSPSRQTFSPRSHFTCTILPLASHFCPTLC